MGLAAHNAFARNLPSLESISPNPRIIFSHCANSSGLDSKNRSVEASDRLLNCPCCSQPTEEAL